MKKCGLVLRALLAASVAAYLLLMPDILAPRLAGASSGVRQQDVGQPVGIVTVWHIAGFKPYSGSVGEWIKGRASEVERKNYGLFFDVTSMTVEEFTRRRADGERADVYSFPMGLMAAEELRPLQIELQMLALPYRETGEWGGETFAAPYLASGYALYENMRLAQGSGNASGMEGALLEKSVAGGPVPLALNGFACEPVPVEDFKSGKCAYAVADYRLGAELMLLQQRGTGFVFSMQPAGEWNDLVQLIGVGADTDDKRLEAAGLLIERMLMEKHQQKLVKMGLFPAADIVFEPNDIPDVLKSAAAPMERCINTFSYERSAKELTELALRVLGGEAGAADALEECVTRLFMEVK